MDDSPGRVKDDPQNVIRRATGSTGGDAARESGDIEERTSQLRTEIEETRVEMTETIDAIQDKLTPRNIVANATDRTIGTISAGFQKIRYPTSPLSPTAQRGSAPLDGRSQSFVSGTSKWRLPPIQR